MNSFQRCMAAVTFQTTDRVPTDLHNFMMCAKESGDNFGEYVLNPKKMADMQIQLWAEFGQDMLLVENGTASLAQALGCGIAYRKDAPPVAHKAAIHSLNELYQLRLTDNILDAPLIKANIETVRLLKQELGDDVFIMGRADQGPLSLASQLYGMDRLLMDLADEECEESIHQLLEVCAQASIIYSKALLDAGAHGTSIGDSTAGPDVLSPDMYTKFALPYEKKIVHAVHEANGYISLHICGNATKIIPKMVQTEADILEIDQKTVLSAAIEQTKGKCALLGQISPITLMSGTPQEVKKETDTMIQTIGGKNASGIILGPGCAVGGATPHQNIRVMLERVQE